MQIRAKSRPQVTFWRAIWGEGLSLIGVKEKKRGAYKTLEHNTLIYNIEVNYHNGDNFDVTVASPSKRENHL